MSILLPGFLDSDFIRSLTKEDNILEKMLTRIEDGKLPFEEFWSEGFNDCPIQSFNLKAKDGTLTNMSVKFKNGDSISYDKNKREVQDALVFIEENK